MNKDIKTLKVASRKEWLRARLDLLKAEKEHTQRHDSVIGDRRVGLLFLILRGRVPFSRTRPVVPHWTVRSSCSLVQFKRLVIAASVGVEF